MNVTQLQAYRSLLHPSVKLWIQAHGETGTFALACEGPEDQIQLFHNLFSNFDPRPRDQWGDFPSTPRLKRLYDNLAYINITKERLWGTIYAYMRGNIELLDMPGKARYDADKDEIVIDNDDEAIDALAKEAATHFIDNEIKTRTFVPTPTVGGLDEFAVSPRPSLVGAN